MLSVEVGQRLEAEGFGIYDATGPTGNIFADWMPESPDAAIAVYGTGGPAADMSTGIYRPSIHIEVRDPDRVAAWAKAKAIMTYFHGSQTDFILEGTRVLLVACAQSDPIGLGQDENQRHRYAVNLEIITQE